MNKNVTALKRNPLFFRHFTLDKKLEMWGYGEWIEEIDYKIWEYKKTTCQIVRSNVGSLCGYISVRKEHPWFNQDYENIDVDVHGGLTFGQMRKDGNFYIGFDCAHYGDIVPSFIDPMREFRRSYDQLSAEMKEIIDNCDESLRKCHQRRTELQSKHDHFVESYKNISFVKRECESVVDQMLESFELVECKKIDNNIKDHEKNV